MKSKNNYIKGTWILLVSVLCAFAPGGRHESTIAYTLQEHGNNSMAADLPAQLQYPDLWSWPKPGYYMHDVIIEKRSGRKLLRFSVAIVNRGAGPLELRATVDGDGTTRATQWVYDDQGGHIERYAGTFEYSGHEGHNHFHFTDFANYRLRWVLVNNGLGSVARKSDKVSFAMFDVKPFDRSLPGAPYDPVYYRQEGTERKPQGISVGWADVYWRSMGLQWIDITGLRDGQYWLEVSVDPNELIAESNENNNVAYVKVFIKGNRAWTNSDQPSGATRQVESITTVLPIAANESTQTVTFYPNPGRGEFDVMIEEDYTGSYHIAVRDFSGKTWTEQSLTKGEKIVNAKIDLTRAPRGLYVLSVYRNGTVTNKTLVVTD